MLRFPALFPIVTLALGCFWGLAPAQVGQQPPPGGPSAFLVAYDTEANLDPNTAQLYQSMVNVLNGYSTVPVDRTNFYSAVNNANGCSITGWHGIISAVQANCNGYLVTLAVRPALASETYGQACVLLDSNYAELYQVNNDGTFQYAGFLDPMNQAGYMPAIVGL